MTDFSVLAALAERKYEIDKNNTWYKGINTYLDALKEEVDEVKAEIPNKRLCYLEDELADILWNVINTITILENQENVSLNSIIERTIKKYSERIEGIESGTPWKEIKALQKERLRAEQLSQENS